jgi:hypothetical protein
MSSMNAALRVALRPAETAIKGMAAAAGPHQKQHR